MVFLSAYCITYAFTSFMHFMGFYFWNFFWSQVSGVTGTLLFLTGPHPPMHCAKRKLAQSWRGGGKAFY